MPSGPGGGGGAGRASAGHDTTGRPIGVCLLSQGAHGVCSPPPQHLTRHGDDVLATGGRGSAGTGGREIIVGRALWPCGVTVRPMLALASYRYHVLVMPAQTVC